MTVTFTNSRPTVSATLPTEVVLRPGQATAVTVTASTGNTETLGTRAVFVQVDDSDKWVQLTQQTGPTTFVGQVAMSQTVGTRTVHVIARCVEAPTVATDPPATATTTGLDRTPPMINCSYPHLGEPTPVSDIAAGVPAAGTATDAQGKVVAVRWSLAADDPNPAAATIIQTPWTTNWSVAIPLASYGDYTLYTWADDDSGNTATAATPFTVVPAYRAQDVEDRLSERWYLLDLLNFATDGTNGQLTKPDGNRPTQTDIARTLDQDVTRLALPNTGVGAAEARRPINELRVPIEILRRRARELPDPPDPRQAGYVTAAYASALSDLGTTYQQLRLARAATQVDRQALADQLGVPLDGPAGPGSRPDQLDLLTLDGTARTEDALEQMFGIASTLRADPMQPINTPQILVWQREAARSRWSQEYLSPPLPTAYTAVIDPDLLTEDEVLDVSLTTVLAARLKVLDDRATELEALRSDNDPPASTFKAMLQTGLPNTFDFPEVKRHYDNGEDITDELNQAGLDQPGFAYLLQVNRLTGISGTTVTTQEWRDLEDVLVASLRRRSATTWRQEEISANYVFGPEAFRIGSGPPPRGTYRIDTAARADWERTLTTRRHEFDALTQATSERVSTAERVAFPILRDSLLLNLATNGQDINSLGDALTRRYLLDIRAGGTLTTTRIRIAIVSVQLLYRAVRNNDVAADSPARRWTATDWFDHAWPAMSSWATWRAATTSYLFPEMFLDPIHNPHATPNFLSLVTTLGSGGITASDALSHQAVPAPEANLGSWEAVVQTWLRSHLTDNPVFTIGPEITRDQRAGLATLCRSVLTANPADLETPRLAFWCTPMLIGNLLTSEGSYESALAWYSLVYPYSDSTLASIYPTLTAELTSPLIQPQLGAVVWPTKPTTTHPPPAPNDAFGQAAVPASRTAPHARATILAILRCLLAYADSQFTAQTDESLALARVLYLQAQELAGHPCLAAQQPATTYDPTLDIPYLSAARLSSASQLTKLRQGRNITGQVLTPISSSADVISQPTPYPFKLLLARAQQLTQQAGQIEGQYANALANLDTQSLKLADAQNGIGLANLQVQAHLDAVTAAQQAQIVAAAQATKATNTVSQLKDAITSNANGNQHEQRMLADFKNIRGLQDGLAGVGAAIGIAQAAASWNVATTVMSLGVDAGATLTQIAGYGAQSILQTCLNNAQEKLQANQVLASVENRLEEWRRQLASAQDDVTVTQAQATLAMDQTKTAQDELAVANQQAKQAQDTLARLQQQYLSAAMYEWLAQVYGGTYRYFLQLACATARLAQAQLAFERTETEQAFIRSDYWVPPSALRGSAPSDTHGLAGAELLLQDLTKLDQYAFSTDQRRLNITQTFSVAQLYPLDFLTFRRTGDIAITTPNRLFDQDFPGHLARLVRQVKVSLVALVPPNRGIRAQLTNNGVSRVTTRTPNGTAEVIVHREPSVVALTSPVSDAGIFGTVDLQPQLLLPFEGSGVDTTWNVSMPPAANAFDYDSIADLLLTVEYTAIHDIEHRTWVVRQLNTDRTRGGDCLISLATDYPDAWYGLCNPAESAQTRSATVTVRQAQFPVHVTGVGTTAISVQLVPGTSVPATVTLAHNSRSAAATSDTAGTVSTRRGAAAWTALFGDPIGDWVITLDDAGANQLDAGQVDDILLDLTWSGLGPTWPT